MAKLEFENVDQSTEIKVLEFVSKNYPSYKGLDLIIRKVVDSSVIHVLRHENGSPLILNESTFI